MKLLTLFITLLFATMAFAGFQGFNSTSDLDIFNKLQCDAGMSCSKVGDKFQMDIVSNGYNQTQVASTTTTLTSSQCGSTIVSDSTDVVTLPEASTVLGCRYTIVCGTADDFDVNPSDGTDAFGPINSIGAGTSAAITPSAGDAIRCTDIGSSLIIEAVGANLWVPVGTGNGAWTDVN